MSFLFRRRSSEKGLGKKEDGPPEQKQDKKASKRSSSKEKLRRKSSDKGDLGGGSSGPFLLLTDVQDATDAYGFDGGNANQTTDRYGFGEASTDDFIGSKGHFGFGESSTDDVVNGDAYGFGGESSDAGYGALQFVMGSAVQAVTADSYGFAEEQEREAQQQQEQQEALRSQDTSWLLSNKPKTFEEDFNGEYGFVKGKSTLI